MTTPQSLLVATQNKGKLEELRQLLEDLPLELYGLSDFPDVETVPETGESFIENASLKAAGYAAQTGLLTLADDSGLEVDALGGAPGIRSARYAGESASDADRTSRLLAELSNIPAAKRSARFVSAVAIATSEGQIMNVSVGTCDGHIDFAPHGSEGFGYDPVFIPGGYDQSFGELESAIKNQLSHRARALSGTREFLRTLTIPSSAG
ncbi:MAG TPA: RdgB/HAM1 family non-canonical purine NTP pyrophosphatase [Pyrinomonadaceae bacterium]|nr:RdgB/HAM1 family non-canonical purine NTP pyrophosphatase [Pyrinomonadaceae bacterium]